MLRRVENVKIKRKKGSIVSGEKKEVKTDFKKEVRKMRRG